MIYLDMDGVIANFVGGALAVHQHAIDYDQWPAGVWHLEEIIGCTTDQFWERIDQRFEHFWRLLAPYPWMEELIDAIAGTGHPWVVLTSPSNAPACSQGKVQWLQRHFGNQFREYMLVPANHKHLLARPGSILIDDSDLNCDQWRAAGGEAVLFPQPWNTSRSAMTDPMAVVCEALCSEAANA